MGKQLSLGFGVTELKTHQAMRLARLSSLDRDILDFINTQLRPDQFEVWFSQSHFAHTHGYHRSSVNKRVANLRAKGFLTPVGVIQYGGAGVRRGSYTLVYDVTKARKEFEAGGWKQKPEKLIQNWPASKVAKQTKGGRYHHFKTAKDAEKWAGPISKKERDRGSDGRFAADETPNEGVASEAHPGCDRSTTHPKESSCPNSPPTPSETTAPSESQNLEEELFESLWAELKPHRHFESWKRTNKLQKLLEPVMANGFAEGAELLQYAFAGASRDPWWGGHDGKCLTAIDWQRWVPALLKSPYHLERLADEGRVHFRENARRQKRKDDQEKRSQKEEALRNQVKTEGLTGFDIFRKELEAAKKRKRLS